MRRNHTLILCALTLLTGACVAPQPAQVSSEHKTAINNEGEKEQLAAEAGFGVHNPVPPVPYVPTEEQRQAAFLNEWEIQRRASLPRVVSVSFPFNGVTFNPDVRQRRDIGALLYRAESIEIRGRTDGLGEAEDDNAIALQRALAAKRYLIHRGVDEQKITLNYSAASNYIADQHRRRGRRLNRRVDIVFDVASIPE